jgi:hypothetical protein
MMGRLGSGRGLDPYTKSGGGPLPPPERLRSGSVVGGYVRVPSLKPTALSGHSLVADGRHRRIRRLDRGLSPDKNNSTASRRNSSVYFDGRPILASFPETFSQEPVPQKMGELQTWAATRRPTGLRGDVSTEVVARRTAAPAFWSVAEPSGGPAGGRCQPSGMTCT